MKKLFEDFLISLFPIYRFFYNLQGHILHLFYLSDRFKLIPWFDPKIWHKHYDHPSNKPWVREMVRHLYFSTGIMPSPEYQYLLKQEEDDL